VVGNGQQEVEIYSENNEMLRGKKTENDCLVNLIERASSLKELRQVFPEIGQFPFLSSANISERLDATSYKKVKREDGEHELYRLLVVENSWHLTQILGHYVRENESKIYQSSNPHFSG